MNFSIILYLFEAVIVTLPSNKSLRKLPKTNTIYSKTNTLKSIQCDAYTCV